VLFLTITSANPADYSNPYAQPYPLGKVLASYYMWYAPVLSENPYAPPNPGPITGPAIVNETDHAAQYQCPLIDPSPDLTYTFMWSIVPDGSAPVYDIPSTGPADTLVVDWCNYMPGVYDMQCQVYDGTTYVEGPVKDITRSLSTCSGSAHIHSAQTTIWPRYSFSPAAPLNIPQGFYMLPRMDMDFFSSGDFEGQGIMQAGNSTLINFVADKTGIKDAPTVNKYRIPGESFYNPTASPANSPRVVLSLDTAPDLDPSDGYVDNRIIIATSHHHDQIYVIDADNPSPGANPPFDDVPPLQTLTDVLGCKEIQCIAIDKDNDIWACVLGADDQWRLHHWTYIVDDGPPGPYYTYEPTDTLDLDSHLGAALKYDVLDMVSAFANNHLYLFEVGDAPFRGTIHDINLNTSPPTYVTSKSNIMSAAFKTTGYAIDPSMPVNWPWEYFDWGVDTDKHYHAWAGDIMIDHSGNASCEPEQCRLEIMGTLSSWYTEVVRLDLSGNILDRKQSIDTTYNVCAGISTQSDEGERVMIAIPYAWYPLSDESISYWVPPATW
jgi:hypothetical protein